MEVYILTNIIDGMDEARFRSGSTNKNKEQNKDKTEKKKMPMVLKNLKNGS
jgi:nicotinamide mononucleotide adenylyltransferase